MEAENRNRRPWMLLVGAGLVASFSALRLRACFDDLWLDEIWALSLVSELASPLELVTRLRTDNHLLHSLFVYAVGPQAPGWAHRLPSWAAGTGSLVLAGLVGRGWALREDARSGPWPDVQALVSLLLVGASPMLLQYDSEARGYGLTTFFALLAFFALLGAELRSGEWRAGLYWGASIGGLLAHPIFVHVLAGAGMWSCVRAVRDGGSPRTMLARIAWWHAVPTGFAALFYWTVLRRLESGGGPHHDLLVIVGNVCGAVLGLPMGAAVSVAAALLLSALGLRELARQRDDVGVFLLVAIWLSPVLFSSAGQPPFQFERYYVISAALGTLWLAWLLTRWMRSGHAPALLAVALLAAVVGVDAVRLAAFLRDGRGDYRGAIRYVADHARTDPVQVGSDHDFRNRMVLAYHLERASPPVALRYVAQRERPEGGPEWLILHRRDRRDPPGREVSDRDGNRYRLERIFPHAGFSGWHWYLYRNAALGAARP